MKKLIIFLLIIVSTLSMQVFASEVTSKDKTEIPSMSLSEFSRMMQARQVKVDIIKKNNREITALKEELRTKILEAADKVNSLRIDISNDNIEISDKTIIELKSLLEFLQQAKVTLENDVEKISSEIEEILDLISIRNLDLEQYDLLIEKQNSVIVKMKEILEMVNMI